MNADEDKNAIVRLFHVYRNYGSKNALVDITLDIYKNEFLFMAREKPRF
jgi:cell division transport system ATP-binding protein